MKVNNTPRRLPVYGLITGLLFLLSSINLSAQSLPYANTQNFWDKVQFGGGLGLGFGDGYFNGTISPSAIYNFNRYAALGTALNFTYAKEKNFYESYIVGFSLLAIFRPIPEIQISVEPQQSYVNRNFDSRTEFADQKYWVGALFTGIGFNTGNVTIGIQYDLLYDPGRSVYGSSWFPFVRVFF